MLTEVFGCDLHEFDIVVAVPGLLLDAESAGLRLKTLPCG